jgi:hypothetical protein
VALTGGIRVKQRISAVDYRVEAGVQTGHRPRLGLERQTALAYQGDAEAGVNLLDDRLRFALEGLYATGDDPDTADRAEGWDQLYPTAHKFLGRADIIGPRTNVASGTFDLSVCDRPRAGSGSGERAGAETAAVDRGVCDRCLPRVSRGAVKQAGCSRTRLWRLWPTFGASGEASSSTGISIRAGGSAAD